MRRSQIAEQTQTESSASSSTFEIWKPDYPVANGPKCTLDLYGLHGRIDNLLQWIADRETIAEAQEMGQNYDHVQVELFYILFFKQVF